MLKKKVWKETDYGEKKSKTFAQCTACIGKGRSKYYAIEKGVSTVSIGVYAAVLAALNLDNDLEAIALDEEGKRQFEEHNLKKRERATKKINNGGTDDGRE